MKILELFSGTESFSKVARERGHQCFTVDVEPSFKPDLVKDIMDLKIKDIPFEPDVIWSSPPCTTFSVASLRHYWVDGKPKNDKTIGGMMFVCKTLSLIKTLNPKFWFLENPRGMLRKQWFMQGLQRNTVTYCQYGDFRQKPTDIWTNAGLIWTPRRVCKPGASCHESAKRGSDKGTQSIGGGGKNGSKLRSMIPRDLCLEIIKVLEKRFI